MSLIIDSSVSIRDNTVINWETVKQVLNSDFFNQVVIAPIFEELFFRGVVQNSIRKIQNFYLKHITRNAPSEEQLQRLKIYRIGITSFLFGFCHLINPGAGSSHVFVTTVQGAVSGNAMEKTGSLVVPILDHTLWNGICYAGKNFRKLYWPGKALQIAIVYFDNHATVSGTPTVAERLLGSLKEMGKGAFNCITSANS